MDTLQLWKTRFNQAENYRRPHIARMQRMYQLYRAYREVENYAYGTSIMPPIGFQIVETIKPRIASAKIDIVFSPIKKADADSKFTQDWKDIIDYDLSSIGPSGTDFEDLKIWWINAMLIFGNGVIQLSWNNTKPYAEVIDNYLFYVDPQSTARLLDSRWEIKQIFKDKEVIVAQENKRDDKQKLYKPEILKEVENKQVNNDPRTKRASINTLRMSTITDGRQKLQNSKSERGVDKNTGIKQIEIWECWDHIDNTITAIFNRELIAREEPNPYMKVREGRIFFDLPDIGLNWEYYAMSHLEPVETTIYEMADSRNQAMDGIVFGLDPIHKIKKGRGYKATDFKHSPGATWELDNVNDVVFETGPPISMEWISKDTILNRSIQSALALSEYTQGIPQNANEPANKVEMLLAQTGIRLSLLLRQLKIVMKELSNALIQMNQEFLTEDLDYRITGDKTEWKTFTSGARKVNMDARVTIEQKIEKSAVQTANETIALYQALITDEIPLMAQAGGKQLEEFNRKKRVMQKLLISAFDKEEYVNEIMGPEPANNPPANNPPANNPPANNPPANNTPTPITPLPKTNSNTLMSLLARFKKR